MKRGELISPTYRLLVNAMPCYACGRSGGVDAHHHPSRGASGLVFDLDLLPLCRPCHSSLHAGQLQGVSPHFGVLDTLRKAAMSAAPERWNAFSADRNAWWERKQVCPW